MIRKLLGINSRCEFRLGSIETLSEALDGELIDVVICVGVFHHLPSTAEGVRALRAVCGKFLFLETICFPVGFEDDSLGQALELKDIPYFFGNRVFGITGHKLESGYYDGSAKSMSVVSLPSVNALSMFLDAGGFEAIKVEVDPQSYSQVMTGAREGARRFSAVCMSAVPKLAPENAADLIEEYETGLIRTLLPNCLAKDLHDVFLNSKADQSSGNSHPLTGLVCRYINSKSDDLEFAWDSLKNHFHDQYLLEILKNLRYSPADKIALEYGKTLIASNDYERGEEVLRDVTCRLNADWRSCYRAFCILALSLRSRGQADEAIRYEGLLKVSNPQFPASLLKAPPWSMG